MSCSFTASNHASIEKSVLALVSDDEDEEEDEEEDEDDEDIEG
jgi:hypothetical protein